MKNRGRHMLWCPLGVFSRKAAIGWQHCLLFSWSLNPGVLTNVRCNFTPFLFHDDFVTVKGDCVLEERQKFSSAVSVRSCNRVFLLILWLLCKNISADLFLFHCRVILKCSLWRENLDMWCSNCKYYSLKKQGHPSTPVCTCVLVGWAVWSTSQAGAWAGLWNDSWVEGINHEVFAWDGEKQNVSISWYCWMQHWILWSYLVYERI